MAEEKKREERQELTTRIAATSSTIERLKRFVRGTGATSYDQAINMALDVLTRPDEDEVLAGYRIGKALAADRKG